MKGTVTVKATSQTLLDITSIATITVNLKPPAIIVSPTSGPISVTTPAGSATSVQVKVTSPAGGIFKGGQTLKVGWKTTGEVALYGVQLSLDGGVNFQNLTKRNRSGTTFGFKFRLPDVQAEAVIRVVAKDKSRKEISYGDSAPFTIQ